MKRDPRPFRAGEYAFAGPLRPDEVLERVVRGEVKLYRFTVPEGLRAEEIAAIVARSGLAAEPSSSRSRAIRRSREALGVPYASLEGFLFPDTYSFPRGASARVIADAMVARFQEEYAKAEAVRAPDVTLDEGASATLASIVEKETGREDERPRIACVFHNRLRLGMPLQTDPTVMYATMLRTGRWSRNITRADLLARHPYNTYTTAGLPPGPIASAGAAALAGGARPCPVQGPLLRLPQRRLARVLPRPRLPQRRGSALAGGVLPPQRAVTRAATSREEALALRSGVRLCSAPRRTLCSLEPPHAGRHRLEGTECETSGK